MEALRQKLLTGAEALGIALDADTARALMDYLALLEKWNRAYNLTAVRDPGQMVSLHLLDSLTVAPYIDGQHYLDVGTGAGLPGLVLAILYPHKRFELLDSNGKKTRFLLEAVARLGLKNVAVHCARVEQFQAQTRYDGILSRAFASLADFTDGCQHLLADGGRLLAMKGQYPAAELSALPKPFIVEACHRLKVPGVDGERHLLLLRRDTDCPSATGADAPSDSRG